MTTLAQTEANRRNASRSTGPRSAQGKESSRFNATRHGLRAEQIVLPTEDPDEFRLHCADWVDDWKPATATRRHLVERLAVASWRMRRCVRIESARLTERIKQSRLASNQRETQMIDDLWTSLDSEPGRVVSTLETTRGGVDCLIEEWCELEDAAATPEGWKDYDDHHFMFIYLQGVMPGDDEAAVIKGLSWRLVVANNPEDLEEADGKLLNAAEVLVSAAEIRRIIARNLHRLRDLWRSLPDSSAERDRLAELAAFTPRPEDESLRRYESQFEREVSRSIAQLIKLAASDADNAEQLEPEAPNEAIAELPAVKEVAEPALAEASAAPEAIVSESEPKPARNRNGRSRPVLAVVEPVNGTPISLEDQ
jgi:hypothetical protein